jgi:DNA (cytosine-5)-methyltransferase 1
VAPTFIDLFAGIGGFSIGLEMAGFECVAAVERDREIAAHFAQNHRRGSRRPTVLARDIREVTPEDLMRLPGADEGELALVVGGPPCQGFSTMGKRHPGDERNTLVYEFCDHVARLRPRAFVMENVPGLMSYQDGKVVASLVRQFKKAGYRNTKVSLVDATDYGVPQRRRRVLVYGSLAGTLPDLSSGQSLVVSTSVRDAIYDLPHPASCAQLHARGEAAPYSRPATSDYARLLRGARRKVTGWEPVTHCPEVVRGYAATAPGHSDPRTKCYRLVADMPARTLRAGSRTRTACRPIHPDEPRVITVREAARLQSFPDWVEFPTRVSTAHVVIGNAVPPVLARGIGALFLDALD